MEQCKNMPIPLTVRPSPYLVPIWLVSTPSTFALDVRGCRALVVVGVISGVWCRVTWCRNSSENSGIVQKI